MSLYVGGTKINRVLVNGSDVNQLYIGATKMWANGIEFVGSASAAITTSTSSAVNVSGINIRLVRLGRNNEIFATWCRL